MPRRRSPRVVPVVLTALLLALAAAAFGASHAAAAPPEGAGAVVARSQPFPPGTLATVRADGDCLRMRAGPGLDASVVTCLPEGTQVTVMPVTEERSDYRWQLVSSPGGVGWVADLYLTAAGAAAPPGDAPAVQFAALRPGLSGSVPSAGLALVVWGGGTTSGIITAALARGCSLDSIWTTSAASGSMVGYITRAPAPVNRGWGDLFPGGDVPPGTPLMLGCSAQPASSTVPLSLVSGAPPARGGGAPGPATRARAAVVIDADSGAVLYDQDGHARLAPASLTKIATAIVAIEGSATAQWVPGSVDSRTLVGSSVMGLLPGDSFTLRDLLYGLMLPSGNDAALAIARYVGGSDAAFVREMNALARRLGLQDTVFTDPHGLGGPGHYTSAYDLALLSRYGMTLSLFREIAGASAWTARGSRAIPLHTLNPFLGSYAGANGIKTGFTEQAGHTLAVSAVRDGHRLIAVLMDDDQSNADAQRLMDWAFATYRWP